MKVLYARRASLDVQKDTIVLCVRCVSPPYISRSDQYPDTRQVTHPSNP
jgi:hypothetical protein